MRKLMVFDNVSLDGCFVDADGDMSWAHNADPEWIEFTSGNARQGGELVFGRVTYEMMASYWPTPAAKKALPQVAKTMNGAPKVVFSRTLKRAEWENTRLFKDLPAAVRKLKKEDGPDLVVMGSGSIVAQLTEAKLVDSYQLVVHPLALGGGRSLFEGLRERRAFALEGTRAFKNGNVLLSYRPA